MKTDTIFYEIFKEFPNIFFELIGQPEIDPNTYQFQAPEVKQLAFRLDGLFCPLAEFPDQPLYFVEIQFYNDPRFYERLFTSIFLYFSQYQPPNPDWYAIVIYKRRRRRHQNTIHSRYHALVERHLRLIYLDDLRKTGLEFSLGVGIIKLIVERRSQAQKIAPQLVVQARQELTDPILQEQVLRFIQTIVLYKFPQLSTEEIKTMLNLDLIKHSRVYQEAKEEGKEEGKLEGRLETIAKLLAKGFTIEEVANLLDLDVETVKKAEEMQ